MTERQLDAAIGRLLVTFSEKHFSGTVGAEPDCYGLRHEWEVRGWRL